MKTGDKVVCVATKKEFPNVIADYSEYVFGESPQKGQVYCVEAVVNNGSGLRLTISTVYHKRTGIEVGWASFCFRLVSEVGHPPIQVEQPLLASL